MSLFIQAAPKTKTAPATTFPAPISIPIRPRKLAASSNSLNQNESKSKLCDSHNMMHENNLDNKVYLGISDGG